MNPRLLRGCLYALGFGCLWVPICDDPPLHSGAFVQDVEKDRAAVAMITRTDELLALEVTDAAGAKVQVPVEMAPQRRHLFRFAGLQPGTEYRYRIVALGGEERDAGQFRTAPADDQAPVHFAVVGDSGDQAWWVWLQRSPLWHLPARNDWLPPADKVSRIGERIAAAKPDFVLHVGDIVYPWGHAGHYASGFFRPFAAALRQAPFYVALGNHDILDDDGRQALANFALPAGTGDERCYSVAWGSVRVVVCDFGLQDPDNDRVAAGHPAREFLARELAAATEPWLVVASHYPIFSASRQYDRADLAGEVLPLLEEHGVDLYLCGHDHTYQRFGVPGELVQVVSGGGGKSLYEVRPDRRAQVALSQYHWCMVEALGRELHLRARGIDGALLDTVTLKQGPENPRFAAIQARNPARAKRIGLLR